MTTANQDMAAAVERLEEIYNKFEAADRRETMLPVHWFQAYLNGDLSASCVPHGSPTSYRLVEPASEDGQEDTELAFRMIGIVDQVNLPPFQHRFTRPSTIAYLQQRISIAAPQSESYARNARAVTDILQLMATMAPFGVDTHSVVSSIHRPINFSNRMFTPRDFAQVQITVPLTHIMDPLRDLRTVASSKDLVHTEENSVQYLHYREDSGYLPTSPRSFHRGDIVEVHFTPVLFHSQKDHLFPKLVLRSIVSLDNSLSKIYRMRAVAEPATEAPPCQKLKRKRIADTGTVARRILGDLTNKQGPESSADVEMAEVRKVQRGIDSLTLAKK